jgi:hypothetical protein
VLAGERDPLENLSKAFENVPSYMKDARPLQDVPTLALPPGTRGTPSQVKSGAPIKLLPQGDTNSRTSFGKLLPPSKKQIKP